MKIMRKQDKNSEKTNGAPKLIKKYIKSIEKIKKTIIGALNLMETINK